MGTHGYLDVLILASLLLRDAVAVVLAAETGVLVFTFTLGSDCDSVASPDLEFGRDPFPVCCVPAWVDASGFSKRSILAFALRSIDLARFSRTNIPVVKGSKFHQP